MIDGWKDLAMRWNHCCSPEIPTVFGEEWSYYERVCKLIKYLDDTMHDVNLLKDFVENYFKNLDVTQEVMNILMQMAQDGTLTQILGGSISVKLLGAKGDGITDDSQAFINAMNLSINGGGWVYVPQGTYRIKNADMLSWKACIYGQGEKSVISLDNTISIGYACKIEHLRFTTQSATNTNVCMLMDNEDISMRDVSFFYTNGIALSFTTKCTRDVIEDCRFLGCGIQGKTSAVSIPANINNLSFLNCRFIDTGLHAIECMGNSIIYINHCYFSTIGNHPPYPVVGGCAVYCPNEVSEIYVQNCWMQYVSWYGIYFANANASIVADCSGSYFGYAGVYASGNYVKIHGNSFGAGGQKGVDRNSVNFTFSNLNWSVIAANNSYGGRVPSEQPTYSFILGDTGPCKYCTFSLNLSNYAVYKNPSNVDVIESGNVDFSARSNDE